MLYNAIWFCVVLGARAVFLSCFSYYYCRSAFFISLLSIGMGLIWLRLQPLVGGRADGFVVSALLGQWMDVFQNDGVRRALKSHVRSRCGPFKASLILYKPEVRPCATGSSCIDLSPCREIKSRMRHIAPEAEQQLSSAGLWWMSHLRSWKLMFLV